MAKKRLGNSVVPAVSTPTHTGLKLVGFTKSQPIITAVLGGRAGSGNSDIWIEDDSSAFWVNNVGQERRNHESQTTRNHSPDFKAKVALEG
jgi:hypothetical protein